MGGQTWRGNKGNVSSLYLAKDVFPTHRKMHLALIRMASCCSCPSSAPLLVASLCQFCVAFLCFPDSY